MGQHQIIMDTLVIHVQMANFSKERMYETWSNQRNKIRSVAMETRGSKCYHGYILASRQHAHYREFNRRRSLFAICLVL